MLSCPCPCLCLKPQGRSNISALKLFYSLVFFAFFLHVLFMLCPNRPLVVFLGRVSLVLEQNEPPLMMRVLARLDPDSHTLGSGCLVPICGTPGWGGVVRHEEHRLKCLLHPQNFPDLKPGCSENLSLPFFPYGQVPLAIPPPPKSELVAIAAGTKGGSALRWLYPGTGVAEASSTRPSALQPSCCEAGGLYL